MFVFGGISLSTANAPLIFPNLLHVQPMVICGPGSVVGIATGYGLDGPGIEASLLRASEQ